MAVFNSLPAAFPGRSIPERRRPRCIHDWDVAEVQKRQEGGIIPGSPRRPDSIAGRTFRDGTVAGASSRAAHRT